MYQDYGNYGEGHTDIRVMLWTDKNHKCSKGVSMFFLKLYYYICIFFVVFTLLFIFFVALFITGQ